MVSDERSLPSSLEPGRREPKGRGFDLATAKNVKWVTRLGSMNCSTPAVVDGRVFLGAGDDGQGLFLCFDEQTGKLLWQWSAPPRDVPTEFDGRKFWFSHFPRTLGVCSSPTVDGDRVYFVTHRLEVLCLDVKGQPADGGGSEPGKAKVVWMVDMWDLGVRPSDACNCSVLIHGDLVYVCTSNGVDRDADTRRRTNSANPGTGCPEL